MSVATVGGSIEFSAFDKIERSIELHVRFEFRRRENEDVARLIAANLVLLVIFYKSCWVTRRGEVRSSGSNEHIEKQNMIQN